MAAKVMCGEWARALALFLVTIFSLACEAINTDNLRCQPKTPLLCQSLYDEWLTKGYLNVEALPVKVVSTPLKHPCKSRVLTKSHELCSSEWGWRGGVSIPSILPPLDAEHSGGRVTRT